MRPLHGIRPGHFLLVVMVLAEGVATQWIRWNATPRSSEDAAPRSSEDAAPKNSTELSIRRYSPFYAKYTRGMNFSSALSWYNLFVCRGTCHEMHSGIRSRCALCYCDDACSSYGDCCPDVHLQEVNTTVTNSFICPPRHTNTESYFMVASCPRDLDPTEVGHQCRTSDLQTSGELPVTDLQSQITYLNQFCARCNNATRFKKWSIFLNCTDGDSARAAEAKSAKELLQLVLEEKICDIDAQPPKGVTARACTPVREPLISTCNVTGNWPIFDELVVRACASFKVPVLQFQNCFCLLCNSNKTWNRVSLPSRSQIPNIERVPLLALFNLQDDEPDSPSLAPSRGTRLEKTRTSCEDAYFFDPASRSCRAKSCSNGKMLKKDACVSVVSKSSYFSYHGTFHLTMTITQGDLKHITLFLYRLKKLLDRKLTDNFRFQSFSLLPTSVHCLNDEAVFEVTCSIKLYTPSLHFVDRTESKLLAMFGNASYSGSFGRATVRLSERSMTDDQPLHTRNPCPPNDTQDVGKSKVSFQDQSDDFKNFVVKNLSPLLTCVQMDLTSDEYIYLNESNSLVVLATNTVVLHPRFSLKETMAAVCVDEYLSGFQGIHLQETDANISHGHNFVVEKQSGIFSTLSSTAGTLSFSCSVISLILLALTFAAYIFFKELRTISGSCNMCMIGVWFLAQAVFEFGAEQTEVAGLCVALGILAHYLWLSATFWMNACTLLLFSRLMFPLRARITLHSRAKVLVVSSVYALLSPALIVASAVSANFSFYGDLGYGGAICYIKRAATRRYGLALPIGCLIVVNLCLFAFTVIRLRQRSTPSSTVDTKIDLVACAKLSVITGLTWLSLFLYEAFPYEVIAYLAIVLFGLHGLVVFMTFACKEYLARLHACTMGRVNSASSLAESYSTSMTQCQIRGNVSTGNKGT